MKKTDADKLIVQYRDKIFGFALDKMKNISQAEELSSDIISEVYMSFLSADNIVNVDGYVYRVARNVYAKYIHKLTTGRNISDISEMSLPYNDENFYSMEEEETINRLKNEIGFLSKRQRTVIYMFYYEKKSVSEIAKKLDISQGTVKWHLSDARDTLKVGINMTETKNLKVNPIKFFNMGHSGTPGTKGDTSDMFDTRLKQNIAWSCYWQAKTLEEISRDVGVPSIYVADELAKLVEYAYIDKMDNSKNPKYRTNMYITDSRVHPYDKYGKMYKDAAKYFCDNFYPKVFESFDSDENNWGFFIDDNDKNFMKYNLVMLCCNFAYSTDVEDYWKTHHKLSVKRCDGGDFIAHAVLSDDCEKEEGKNLYWSCGSMSYGTEHYQKISVDCRFSNRSELTWRDDLSSDWESLYKFIKSGNDKNALEVEEYKRLCDKAYIIDDKVQVMAMISKEDNKYQDLENLIKEKTADISKDIMEYSKKFDEKYYELGKEYYPKNILPIFKLYSTNSLSGGHMIPYLVEEMLEREMLKSLTDMQKKSVFTVFAYDKQ